MTKREYEDLQERLSKKLGRKYFEGSQKRAEGFEKGILVAKSIVKSVYQEYEKKRRRQTYKSVVRNVVMENVKLIL